MSDEMISLGEKLKRRIRANPDGPIVSCGDKTLTAAQFNVRTNRIARALEGLGVGLGDFVTIGLPNGIEFIEATWACWKIGATPQPVSFRLPPAELQVIVDLADPRVVIALPGMETDRKRVTVDDLLALSNDEDDLDDRTAPILKAPTSGGSTGRPKLILSGGPGVTLAEPRDGGLWRFRVGDTSVVPGPLYHNAPFNSALVTLTYDGHLVVMTRFDAEEVLAEIDRHKASWICLVPTMMSRIWRLPLAVRKKYDVSSLVTLWHLAAPCAAWLKEAYINWLGADVIMEIYGGTEGQAATVITGSEWLDHRGSVGRPLLGEIVAFGPDNQPLAAGEVGEIYMRRDQGTPPTYAYRGADARVLGGGWESLGDMGWFDADGYLYLADRRTDMILIGGANVYPAEVEAALDEHPLVFSSAVIGLPDEEMGAQLHAIVQPGPGVSEEELRAHLADRLVTYKRPRTYEFVNEPLRDDAGKMRRTQLRDERIASQKARDGDIGDHRRFISKVRERAVP